MLRLSPPGYNRFIPKIGCFQFIGYFLCLLRTSIEEKVKEIIEDNKKGIFPEQLEDFAFIKEQKNNDYGEDGQNVDLSKLE